MYQKHKGKDPVICYTQPKELDAQIYGFKRLSKLTKTPLMDVIRNWFETHRDIHQLDDKGIKSRNKEIGLSLKRVLIRFKSFYDFRYYIFH